MLFTCSSLQYIFYYYDYSNLIILTHNSKEKSKEKENTQPPLMDKGVSLPNNIRGLLY